MNIKMIAVVTAVTTARANDQRNTSSTNLEASRLCLGSQALFNHARPILQSLDLLSHPLDQALGFTRIVKLAILDVTLVLLVRISQINHKKTVKSEQARTRESEEYKAEAKPQPKP
ncbi:hypothetical protein Tco_1021067 [Tanacetum coccineum]